MVTQIAFPSRLDVNACVAFCRKLAQLGPAAYAIDFGDFQHAPPFGMLMAGLAIRKFSRRMQLAGTRLIALGHKNNTYAAHMGFFRLCGLQWGNAPGQAKGSNTYVPISCISLRTETPRSLMHDELNRQSTRLVNVLMRKGDLVARQRLHYCLFEMMRNVAEHSQSHLIWHCAQLWPNLKQVELAIIDEGVGIAQTLARRYNVKSDAAALTKAIEEGVTRAVQPSLDGFGPQQGIDLDADQAREDTTRNTGYGLFVVSRLCQEEGEFALASGDSCLCISQSQRDVIDSAHQGVGVRLFLRTQGEAIGSFIRRVATREFGDTPSTRPRPMSAP